MSDLNEYVIEPLKKFYVDASYLVRKCEKPDAAGTYLFLHCFESCLCHCVSFKEMIIDYLFILLCDMLVP